MTKRFCGKRQARRGNGSRIGVADQRKNGMIKGRRRDFDRSLLGSRGMRRQNLAHQFPLARNHKTLIFERIIALFLDQRGDVFIFEKKLVEPGDLRQHLQVGEILRLKIFLGFLGRVPVLAESFPQFPVARIASDQIAGLA
jgi:hypothetical protein